MGPSTLGTILLDPLRYTQVAQQFLSATLTSDPTFFKKTTENLRVHARAELEQSQQLILVPLFTICALPLHSPQPQQPLRWQSAK